MSDDVHPKPNTCITVRCTKRRCPGQRLIETDQPPPFIPICELCGRPMVVTNVQRNAR